METFSKLIIELAVREDLGTVSKLVGDVTSIACIDKDKKGAARIIYKEEGVVCGHAVAEEVLRVIGSDAEYKALVREGHLVGCNENVALIKGSLRDILTAERTLLNFMQRLSGIATVTKKLVDLIRPYNVRLLDTRKTTPGMRELEKYAVRIGGGTNHRIGLYDEFLIKNNHIDSLEGNIALAVKRCKDYNSEIALKVEVRNRGEIDAALKSGVNALLLDNFKAEDLEKEVAYIRSLSPDYVKLEASGGITPDNILAYAKTGVDEISLGFLTHSVKSIDISLRIE